MITVVIGRKGEEHRRCTWLQFSASYPGISQLHMDMVWSSMGNEKW